MDSIKNSSILTQFCGVNVGGFGDFRHMFPLNSRDWGTTSKRS